MRIQTQYEIELKKYINYNIEYCKKNDMNYDLMFAFDIVDNPQKYKDYNPPKIPEMENYDYYQQFYCNKETEKEIRRFFKNVSYMGKKTINNIKKETNIDMSLIIKNVEDWFEIKKIYNQILRKKIQNMIEFDTKLNNFKSKSFVDENGNYFTNDSGMKFNYIFENKMKKYSLHDSIKKEIENKVCKENYTAIFMTQTVQKNHNIKNYNNLEDKFKLHEKIFEDFNNIFIERLNAENERKFYYITVYELTKKLNLHSHTIVLIPNESIKQFFRKYNTKWKKQNDVGRTHFEVITYNQYLKTIPIIKSLFGKESEQSSLFLFNEKEKGNRLFLTRTKEHSDLNNVGAYVFKYLTKDGSEADILLPKEIKHNLFSDLRIYDKKQNKIITKNFDRPLRYLFSNYSKSYWENRKDIWKDLKFDIKRNEIIKKLIRKNQKEELIELINEEKKYLSKNINKTGIYYELLKLGILGEDIEKDIIKTWHYYFNELYKKGLLKIFNGGFNIGNYTHTTPKKEEKIFNSYKEKLITVAKQKAGIKDPKTLKDYNKINLKLDQSNRRNIPYLQDINYDINDETKWDYLNKCYLSEIKNIEDLNGNKLNFNLDIFRNYRIDFNKDFNSVIVENNNDIKKYVKVIAENFKITNIDNEIFFNVMFITKDNKNRKMINKILSDMNTNEKILNTNFKKGERVIFNERISELDIEKNTVMKIIESINEYVFLEDMNGNINWYPKKILKQREIRNNTFNVEIAYSITINSSQGTSLDNVVYVDVDIKHYNFDLFYVGITRARKKLITLLSEELITFLESTMGNIIEINGKVYLDSKKTYKGIDKYKNYKDTYGNFNYRELEPVECELEKLNNYLLYIYFKEKKIYEDRNILIKKGFKIPKHIRGNKIWADGIKENFEEILSMIEERKLIDTNFEYLLKNDKLNEKQTESLNGILNNGFFILSGEGGTGKTFTMNTIYKNLIENGINNDDILFIAPTNSAVKILSDSIKGANCKTIHNSLKHNTQFSNTKDDSLSYEYIFIDESSMVDLEMLKELFNKTTKETRIVLIGDYRQLQPVQGISPFEYLINRYKENSTVLIENQRIDKNSKLLSKVVSYCGKISQNL